MRTNAGADRSARVLFGWDGGPPVGTPGTIDWAPSTYLALSENADPPNPANVTLPGEITSGTLSRRQAICSHTSGSSVAALQHTFTSDAAVTLNKIGVFASDTGGKPDYETLLDGAYPMLPGGQITVTETVMI